VYGRITEASLRLEHRHNDGTWGRFERVQHDASAHDPERDWAKGKIVTRARAATSSSGWTIRPGHLASTKRADGPATGAPAPVRPRPRAAGSRSRW
jgi:hypothetical protein